MIITTYLRDILKRRRKCWEVQIIECDIDKEMINEEEHRGLLPHSYFKTGPGSESTLSILRLILRSVLMICNSSRGFSYGLIHVKYCLSGKVLVISGYKIKLNYII